MTEKILGTVEGWEVVTRVGQSVDLASKLFFGATRVVKTWKVRHIKLDMARPMLDRQLRPLKARALASQVSPRSSPGPKKKLVKEIISKIWNRIFIGEGSEARVLASRA